MAEEEIVEVPSVGAEEFLERSGAESTVLDLREADEVLVHPFEGALNVPYSRIWGEIESVPREKPVYVLCRTGDTSGEVVQILAARGYRAFSVDGGFEAVRKVLSVPVEVDARGEKCPGPIMKVADTLRTLRAGQRLTARATEDAFASDIAIWCERTGNRLESLEVKDGTITATVEKSDRGADARSGGGNDKNFVVFSGDLDKTIAAFIMANGAAAMGRRVTMFFTFWGLNILRSERKVRVKKSLVERMFGFMMPRGTRRLGLSRMNMGGMGAKMIRSIMKQKGIKSLEELVQDAISHGVKVVACQMSMDIMGIRKEELIDGVSLGGVSTFLGAGEKSDMSLFI